ncbi:transglutaminase domain-containing protein [Psychroserpens sp. Hel_I_66]|uniref:transglutaminase domain-containing protein n=1 Tax=Psychroserpens sp. Hel_I_66 TaxID=1250004 RepID=UPI000645C8FF|nr:transglutaminase domain-containing protein [Psychroserpens sp. Hel_I_66]
MAYRNFFLMVMGLIVANVYSQNKLPTINANSTTVDILEDGVLKKGYWSIAPEVNPDIYETSSKNITFYTDIDSISFEVSKNKYYDFEIIINQKESAITRIQWVPSRLDMLKQASEYEFENDSSIPKFSYQSKESPELVKLRRELKLDSIAGNGNELSQIFNLFKWADNVVEHDGSSSNPTLRNAIDLLKICKTENRGLNCRMLSIFLNECYLAMGIKSRYVTCMPKETDFDECHVINMVYSNDLDKWLWIDPTNGAYVMDDKGNLLSIPEVRERLINDKGLVLNADANWNRSVLKNKTQYLNFYMAKNLYRFQTPLISEYNSETIEEGKEITFVELLPLDGIVQEPKKKVDSDTINNVKRMYYKTNNPSIFWAKPE